MAEGREDLFNKLPDEILAMIFQQLPVPYLMRCTQLCKRFSKLLLTPGEFWRTYVQNNYDFKLVEKKKAGHELSELNLDPLENEWYCFWDKSNDIPPPNDPARYVFRPFPQMWTNGIITPANFEPFSRESDYDYFALNKALYLLLQLRKKCEDFQVSSAPYYSSSDTSLDVCLLPWQGKELPDAKQVLEIFNTHAEIIRSRSENETEISMADKLEFEPDEYFDQDTDYERDITLLNNTFSTLYGDKEEQKEFYEWLQKLFQPSLMFAAGVDAMHPQLYFHITILSPGWVGGVFATLNLV